MLAMARGAARTAYSAWSSAMSSAVAAPAAAAPSGPCGSRPHSSARTAANADKHAISRRRPVLLDRWTKPFAKSATVYHDLSRGESLIC